MNNISKAILSDRPIAYHPIIAKICRSVTAALFFSQIAYWSDKGKDPDGWIYKTEEEMNDETGLSRSEQESARKTLAWLGILKQERRGIPARMWYLIDWEALETLLGTVSQTSCRKPANKLQESREQDAAKPANSTENTPETTPYTTALKSPADNSSPQPVDNSVETLAEEPGDLEALFRAEEERPGIVVQRVGDSVPLTPEAAKERIKQAMVEFAETGGMAGVSDPVEQKAAWVREVASKISSVLGYRAVTKDCLTVAGRLWGRNFKKYDDSTATEAEILGRLDFYAQSGEYKNKSKVNPYLVPRILENDFARAPDEEDTATGLVISV